jgi:S-DNA-T family DNA segregation ATPase FtsK/SpoIIIE
MSKVINNWEYPPLTTVTDNEGSPYSILASDVMQNNTSKLSLALGFDVLDNPVVGDLKTMSNLLITGKEESGKTHMVYTLISSLLFRNSPSELRLIIMDPSKVESTAFNGIPHLLAPVITEPEKAISALRWTLMEIDRRYKKFVAVGARNVEGYNEMAGFQDFPYIVLFVDDYSEIQFFSPVEVNDSMKRILEHGKEAGVYVVISTAKPDKNLIDDIQSKISFTPEPLLAPYDFLLTQNKEAFPICLHSAFTSDSDLNRLIYFVKNQESNIPGTDEVTSVSKFGVVLIPGLDGEPDPLFKNAVREICQYDRASASLLQRRLSIGYARAARLIDQLETAGVLGPTEGSKPREVLVQDAEAFLEKHAKGI